MLQEGTVLHSTGSGAVSTRQDIVSSVPCPLATTCPVDAEELVVVARRSVKVDRQLFAPAGRPHTCS